jgi:hypothetical protein
LRRFRADNGRLEAKHRWNHGMRDMTTVEVKALVPSKDFALSKHFYQDLGFDLAWSSEDLAYLRHGNSSFLLQNFYKKEHADNFMMHLLVESPQSMLGCRLIPMRRPNRYSMPIGNSALPPLVG